MAVTILVFLFYVHFSRKIPLLVIFAVSMMGLGLVFGLVHGSSMRHKGVFFLLFIMMFWLDEFVEQKEVLSTQSPNATSAPRSG